MDAVAMFNNIYGLLQGVWPMFTAIALCIGAITVCGGLRKFAAEGRDGQSQFGKGLSLVLLGGALAGLPELISLGGETLIAQGLQGNALAFQARASDPVAKAALSMGVSLVKLVGLVAIWKAIGRLRLNASGESNPRLVSEAGTLFIMGLVAVFFPQVLKAIGATVGGKVSEFIGTYFI